MYHDCVLLRVMLDTFSMVKEISVMEQRYQAVLAVIADGRGVGGVAAQFGVSRQSVFPASLAARPGTSRPQDVPPPIVSLLFLRSSSSERFLRIRKSQVSASPR